MARISVLLVDDNPTFLRILTRFLQEHSQNEVVVVGTATRGKEALSQAALLQPDVVLLDLAMPDMHGLQVLSRMRQMMPEMSIVVLTLLDPGSYRRATLAAGADGFVSKATLEADLLPTIRRLARADRSRENPVNCAGAA